MVCSKPFSYCPMPKKATERCTIFMPFEFVWNVFIVHKKGNIGDPFLYILLSTHALKHFAEGDFPSLIMVINHYQAII